MNSSSKPTQSSETNPKAPPINIKRARIFDLEASRRCNLKCEFCPRSEFKVQEFMSPQTFDSFLNSTTFTREDLALFCGLGEPMLNPHLPDFITRFKERTTEAQAQIITNGTLLNPENVAMLLDRGIDLIVISFNGTDPQTYERLMKGASFEKSMANLEYTKAEIQRRSGCTTRLMVTYIVSSENMDQEEEVKAFWKAKGLRTIPQYMHNRGGFVELEEMSPLENPEPPARPCLYFQPYTFIAWNGDVLLCCNDIHHQHLLGNINRHNMAQIEARKQEHIDKNDWPELCVTCNAPANYT